MSQQNIPTKNFTLNFDSLKNTLTIASAIILFFVAIATWLKGDNILGDKSDIRYQIIGPIRTKDGFTQGFWLVNRGTKVAQNVEITIIYSDSKVIGDPLYDQDEFISQPSIEKLMQDKKITIKFDRVSPQEQGFIYLSLIGIEERPNVHVRFDDKDGVEGFYKRSFSDQIIITVSIIMNLILLSFLVRLVYKVKKGSTPA